MLLLIPELDKKEREDVVVSMTATELATEIEKTKHPPKPHTGKPLSIEPSATESGIRPSATTERPAASVTLTAVALHVDSTPSGAQVFIDSALAGRTPAVINVQPGIAFGPGSNAGTGLGYSHRGCRGDPAAGNRSSVALIKIAHLLTLGSPV